MRSMRRTALLWMTALIAFVGLAGAVIAYGLALHEANRFMDSQLRQIALNAGPGLRDQATASPRHDPEDDFVVQIWTAAGERIHASPPDAAIPRQTEPGFRTRDSGGIRWRIFSSSDASQTIQVAQQIEVRRELAESAAWQAALPILAVIPIGWLVIGWAVRRILGDLRRLADAIAALPADSREPIDLEQVPVEVRPVVGAMNALIARLRESVLQQRKFLSDAAHELRTPLTALSLQIGNLGSGDRPSASDIQDLESGARRASALVDQLLRMARYDATEPVYERLDLAAVVLDAIADHVPLAESRAVDLGVLSHDRLPITGDPRELRLLFDNLIDNAVKYTPRGGVVDVTILHDGTKGCVTIADTGPGIPPDILPRICDRFVRAAPRTIDGSGLGLAIARAIADRHSLLLSLANRDDGCGLSVTVEMQAYGHR